jgi:hypothetical protein
VSVFLRRKAWLRGAIGVVAAYVLALQTLLAGIVATQMAVGDPANPFVICYGSGDNGSTESAPLDKPRAHVDHANCAICTFAASSPPIPRSPAIARITVAVSFGTVAPAPAIGNDRHNPRSSQGPPQSA